MHHRDLILDIGRLAEVLEGDPFRFPGGDDFQ